MFTEPQVMPVVGTSNEWVHLISFAYTPRSGVSVLILPGAITDGASIPRLLWTLLGSPMRDHRVFKAAAIHDQCYKSLGAVGLFTRRESDQLFRRALIDAGVGWLKAGLYYAGVRAGGWIGWARYGRNSQELAQQAELIKVSQA